MRLVPCRWYEAPLVCMAPHPQLTYCRSDSLQSKFGLKVSGLVIAIMKTLASFEPTCAAQAFISLLGMPLARLRPPTVANPKSLLHT